MGKYLIVFLVGLSVGFLIFGFLNGSVLPKVFKANLGQQISTPLPSVLSSIPTSTPFDFWQKIVADASLSTVAIQSFQNNTLKKQGSGIILSSDGLIVTTLDVVAGKKIQVFFEDKIFQAAIVKKDLINNLALIKAEGGNFNISNLDNPVSYESGQDYILTGKLLDLSKITTFSQKALVHYVLDNKIVLNSQLEGFINGAKTLNFDGQMVGLSYLGGDKVYLVKSSIINDFYNSYLIK